MPKGKWIDKKTAQHFTLVHRQQNDPLIHDSDAPSMVLNPTSLPNASKAKKLDDLVSELGSSEVEQMRANEGEAASYGVYFDDTEYDYMQHLRDLGSGTGEAVFVEAGDGPSNANKGKGKQKQSLDDALRHLDLEEEEQKKKDLFEDEFLPSRNLQHMTYQAQQDVPDVIGGFQPDMDPRLREVLEALEDETYVEEDDDDIFQELAKDGRELDDIEFEGEFDEFGEEDEGWETDDTAKPAKEYKNATPSTDTEEAPELVPVGGDAEAGEGADVVKNDNWLEDFKAFKANQKTGGLPRAAAAAGAPSATDITTTTNGGRRKRRKGALTNPSAYSMTSSSLVRTEQLALLDERFENFERAQYDPNDDDGFPLDDDDDVDDDDDGGASVSKMSAMSTSSTVAGATRRDFDGILDGFLDDYSMHGKKHVRKGNWASGAAQLDEIRRELGPACLPARYGGGGAKQTKQQQQQQKGQAGQQQRRPAAPAAASRR